MTGESFTLEYLFLLVTLQTILYSYLLASFALPPICSGLSLCPVLCPTEAGASEGCFQGALDFMTLGEQEAPVVGSSW